MKNLVVGLGAVLLLSGCATIMTSDMQSIRITSSNNEPAEVTVDDKKVMTPGTILVLRDGKDKSVQTSTEGCENNTLIKKSVTPIFFGNLVIGGVLGSTTDGSTGKMWDYQDDIEVKCKNQ